MITEPDAKLRWSGTRSCNKWRRWCCKVNGFYSRALTAAFLPYVLLLLSLTPAIFSMVHDAAFSSTPPCPPNPHFSDRSPVFSTKATDDAAVDKTGLPGATAVPSTFLHLQLVGRRGRGLWWRGIRRACAAQQTVRALRHISHMHCAVNRSIPALLPISDRSAR